MINKFSMLYVAEYLFKPDVGMLRLGDNLLSSLGTAPRLLPAVQYPPVGPVAGNCSLPYCGLR